MASGPFPAVGDQRLAIIQRLWRELQAARKDPAKYKALAECLRKEADVFVRTLEVASPAGEAEKSDTSKMKSDSAPLQAPARRKGGAKVRQGVGAVLKRSGT